MMSPVDSDIQINTVDTHYKEKKYYCYRFLKIYRLIFFPQVPEVFCKII